MPIFSRREIQRRIDALLPVVGAKNIGNLLRLLNLEEPKARRVNKKIHLEAISATWEVALASSFNSVGELEYEKKISNGKTPDLSFSLEAENGLLAEVVTVSDDQQHSKNPISEFNSTLFKLREDHGLLGKGGLQWGVESVELVIPGELENEKNRDFSWASYPNMPSIRKRKITRLKLPPKEHLEEWVSSKLEDFFREVSKWPHTERGIIIKEAYNDDIEVEFMVQWQPGKAHSGGSYSSYTPANDPERHVLWARLREKSKQFSGASENVPRVVFVCDGGCRILDDVGGGGNRLSDMVRYFWCRQVFDAASEKWIWEEERNISAVIVLPISEKDPFNLFSRGDLVLKPKLFVNPHCPYSLGDLHIDALEKALMAMPKPIKTSESALFSIRHSKIATVGKTNMSMKGEKITFSSVDLLKILAGELTVNELFGDSKNPFATALELGHSIRRVNIKETPQTDDDDLELEFRGFDPAIALFRNPSDQPKEP